MDFAINADGVVRETFTNHTQFMTVKQVSEATLAAGNIYLKEYAKKIKASGVFDNEIHLKKHIKDVYDTFLSYGRCDKGAWDMALKALYPKQDERLLYSSMITENADLFPDMTIEAHKEADGTTSEVIKDKTAIFGSIVKDSVETINQQFNKLLLPECKVI